MMATCARWCGSVVLAAALAGCVPLPDAPVIPATPAAVLSPAPEPSVASSRETPPPLPTPTVRATSTAEPSASARATSSPEPSASARIVSAELGLSIDPPPGWRRLDPAFAWARDSADLPQIEVVGRELPPPNEPEAALLPGPAQVLGAALVDLGWASGREIMLELYGAPPADGGRAPVIAVEAHVLVVTARDGERYVYDFVARARSRDELLTIEPELLALAASARVE